MHSYENAAAIKNALFAFSMELFPTILVYLLFLEYYFFLSISGLAYVKSLTYTKDNGKKAFLREKSLFSIIFAYIMVSSLINIHMYIYNIYNI